MPQFDKNVLTTYLAISTITCVALSQQIVEAASTSKEPLKKAINLLEHGQDNAALAFLNKLISKQPYNAKAYEVRASVYERLGEYQKQITDLSSAIKITPKIANLYESRAIAYYKLWQPTNALADCNAAMKLNAASWKALSTAAFACDELGLFQKAIAFRTKALQLKRKDALAWFNRAEDYESVGRFYNAQADRQRAIDLFSSSDRLRMQSCKPLIDFNHLSDERPQLNIEKQLKYNNTDLPFHYDDEGHICLPLQINGHTLQFMLDTGSAHSSLWKQKMPGVAKIDKLAVLTPEANEKEADYGFFRASNLKLGNLNLLNVWMTVTEGLVGHKCLSGYLGGNILENLVVTVHYANKQVSLAGSSKKGRPLNAIVVPMEIRNHTPHCKVSVNGKLSVMALLDTGCPSSLSAESLLKSILANNKLNLYQHISGPWLGSLWAESIRLQSLKLGDINLNGPLIDVFPAHQAPQAATEIIIGNDLLSRFKSVTFDYPAREVVLEPNNADSQSAPNLYHEGQFYFQHNHQQQAADAFTQAMAMDDELSLACYRSRSTALINLKQYDKAIEDCDAMIRLDSKNSSNYFQRAWAHQGLGKYRLEIADDTTAIFLDPHYYSAYMNRAWAYDRLGEHQFAAEDRRMAEKLRFR